MKRYHVIELASEKPVILIDGGYRLYEPELRRAKPTVFTAQQAQRWMDQQFMKTRKLGQFMARPLESEVAA